MMYKTKDMFIYRNSQVGIELCDQQIRAVSITNVKKQIRINAAAVVDIQHNSQKGTAQALTKAHQLIRYKGEATIFTMNYDDVITKTIHVDASLNDDEIKKHLQTQASHIFGHSSSEIFIDYILVDLPKDSQQQIQAIGAKKTEINLWKKLLADCNFKLRAIDVNIYAIGSVMPFLNGTYHGKICSAILLLQRHQLLLCVVKNKQTIYSITVDYPQLHTIQPDLIILPAFNRALQFFKNVKPEYRIKKIILMGNPDYLQVAYQYLSANTPYDISIAKIDSDRVDASFFDTRLFLSLGAALWKTKR